MKILKRLAACAVALSMTACTAFGTFAVSAEENTETGSASETQLTRLALPNFVLASDLSFLDGEITEVSEADVFNWVEQNFEYLQSFDDYVDIILGIRNKWLNTTCSDTFFYVRLVATTG